MIILYIYRLLNRYLLNRYLIVLNKNFFINFYLNINRFNSFKFANLLVKFSNFEIFFYLYFIFK